jgi:Recombination endonuclease VII
MAETKKCKKCGKERHPTEEYYVKLDQRTGARYHPQPCKYCSYEKVKAGRSPGSQKYQWIRRRFGLNPEQYDDLVSRRNGGCWICGSDVCLCVDHCHQTDGKVESIRGILCRKCNTAIGLLGDNAEGLWKALDYLVRFETTGTTILE